MSRRCSAGHESEDPDAAYCETCGDRLADGRSGRPGRTALLLAVAAAAIGAVVVVLALRGGDDGPSLSPGTPGAAGRDATSRASPTAQDSPGAAQATASMPPATASPATPGGASGSPPASSGCVTVHVEVRFYDPRDEQPTTVEESREPSDRCGPGRYRAGSSVRLEVPPVAGLHPVWGSSPDGVLSASHALGVLLSVPAGGEVFITVIYFRD